MKSQRNKCLLVVVFAAALLTFVSCSARRGASQGANPVIPAAAAETPNDGKPIFNCTSAGRWFPGDASTLRDVVDLNLDAARPPEINGRLVALISPHAGYQFSAPVAAYGYKLLKGMKFDTVVVVGFLHTQYNANVCVFKEGTFRTPLGDVPIDGKATAALIEAHPRIVHNASVFSGEHSLDAQLPFLQRSLGSFKLVPVLVGSQSKENLDALAGALAEVFRGQNALLVASTDMSHFWNYEEARALDSEMAGRIKAFDIPGMAKLMAGDPTGRRMCGHGVTRAVMKAAAALGADKVEILKLANSQDTFGPTGRGVVGYLSAALVDSTSDTIQKDIEKMEETNENELNAQEQKEILGIARKSLETYVRTGKRFTPKVKSSVLKKKNGMFVTLKINGRLRGCMGHFENDVPIGQLAASQIITSAIHDPRFPRVSESELDSIDVEISILSVPERVDSYEDIIVGKHGVILEKRGRGATFLPQVAPEQGWSRDTMLRHLASKAGLSPDAWREGASFKIYTAQVFGETDFPEND